MNTRNQIHTMVLAALLIAVGIVIPIISPIKIVMEPMSFTLASHVAIVIAMFVSPYVAVATALGTTLGFLLYGFPIAVVLRALSHVVWAFVGSYYLKKHPETMTSVWKMITFTIAIACIHAVMEMLIVLPMYVQNPPENMIYVFFGLIGVGTIVHGSIDTILSIVIWKILINSPNIKRVSQVQEVSFH